MTDSGYAYKSSTLSDLLAELTIGHKRTRPYTTSGKAGRLDPDQTSLRESAYASAYQSSDERA